MILSNYLQMNEAEKEAQNMLALDEKIKGFKDLLKPLEEEMKARKTKMKRLLSDLGQEEVEVNGGKVKWMTRVGKVILDEKKLVQDYEITNLDMYKTRAKSSQFIQVFPSK